jgi:hypothetical protein
MRATGGSSAATGTSEGGAERGRAGRRAGRAARSANIWRSGRQGPLSRPHRTRVAECEHLPLRPFPRGCPRLASRAWCPDCEHLALRSPPRRLAGVASGQGGRSCRPARGHPRRPECGQPAVSPGRGRRQPGRTANIWRPDPSGGRDAVLFASGRRANAEWSPQAGVANIWRSAGGPSRCHAGAGSGGPRGQRRMEIQCIPYIYTEQGGQDPGGRASRPSTPARRRPRGAREPDRASRCAARPAVRPARQRAPDFPSRPRRLCRALPTPPAPRVAPDRRGPPPGPPFFRGP